MKTFKWLIIFVVVFSSCNTKLDKAVNQDNIVVSILPQKYFVEQIVGDHFQVNVMIPPGASPVTYEPTPQQMKDLSNSFVYFRIGHIEFEKSWMAKLSNINPEMALVDLSKNATLIQPEDDHEHHDHAHDGHHHHGIDPHIWTSPKEVRKQAELIYQYFISEKPEYKDEFTNRYMQFIDQIDQLDDYLEAKLTPYKGRKFLIFHPALTYIARDYGLEQISIEIDGKEPTPANIQKIIDVARNEGIKIVFIQRQFSTHNAEVIAKEIEGVVVQIDPLEYNWAESIKFIADEIVKSYSMQ